MNAVRYDGDMIGRDQPKTENLVARCHAVRHHVRRFSESAENAFRHGAKPTRARLALRLQHANERIQIVAGDHGSVRRQVMDQLGIAMIDQMKQIELFDVRL